MIERPYVVVHAAVSVDGATTGFEPDLSRFYGLISNWDEDATLVGADTILAQERTLAEAPRPGPSADAPLLAVVDARCRVSEWRALRDCGHWSDVVALRGTRLAPSSGLRELTTGGERVDLAAALAALAREGVKAVRVDSGGELIGALLAAALIDELSLLVHPQVAGTRERRWFGGPEQRPAELTQIAAEDLGDGLAWLRYRVASAPGG